jgi:hypothetical protein
MFFEPRLHRLSSVGWSLQAGLPLILALALGLVAIGCGNKKPPKPPPRIVPATTSDLDVAQRGTELQLSFSYPAVTIGGLPLPGLEAVELWRLKYPMQQPPREDEDEIDDPAAEASEPEDGEILTEEITEEAPAQPSSFLFARPTAEEVVPAEEKIQLGPAEFAALAELEMRIEGAELQAAISGDRILLRLPLDEIPPPEVPEEEREMELFAVICVSTKGLGSELSNVVKILPRTPPTPPAQIETEAGATGINVVWRAEDPEIGFRVYRRDAASRVYGTPIAAPAPEARSHLDQTTLFDTSYVYSVTTVALESPLVESALAAEREVRYEDRYPPKPPTGLLVLAEAGRARVLWEPSVVDDLKGYLIYRRTDAGSGFERLTAEPTLELEYLDETVASGRAYSYYVSAIDQVGNESEASTTVDIEVP